MQHLPASAYRDMPWANGGGRTAEILAWPDARDYALRLSIATIAGPGPFSVLPGVDRTLLLLEGGPLALAVDDAPLTVLQRPGERLAFTGEARVRSDVPAPSRDFNVMTRRERCRHAVQVVELGTGAVHAVRAAGMLSAVFVARGTAISLEGAAGPALRLGLHDTIVLAPDDGELRFVAAQAAMLFVITFHATGDHPQ